MSNDIVASEAIRKEGRAQLVRDVLTDNFVVGKRPGLALIILHYLQKQKCVWN